MLSWRKRECDSRFLEAAGGRSHFVPRCCCCCCRSWCWCHWGVMMMFSFSVAVVVVAVVARGIASPPCRVVGPQPGASKADMHRPAIHPSLLTLLPRASSNPGCHLPACHACSVGEGEQERSRGKESRGSGYSRGTGEGEHMGREPTHGREQPINTGKRGKEEYAGSWPPPGKESEKRKSPSPWSPPRPTETPQATITIGLAQPIPAHPPSRASEKRMAVMGVMVAVVVEVGGFAVVAYPNPTCGGQMSKSYLLSGNLVVVVVVVVGPRLHPGRGRGRPRRRIVGKPG